MTVFQTVILLVVVVESGIIVMALCWPRRRCNDAVRARRRPLTLPEPFLESRHEPGRRRMNMAVSSRRLLTLPEPFLESRHEPGRRHR